MNTEDITSPAKVYERYYTPAEVSCHASRESLWLSWLGNVYDLTKLVQENDGMA
jgi:cytochrome b involved in lipid metabolism